MPEQNRVDPYGEIVSTPLRGGWMGNRGCIHRDHQIVRPWETKRWIICALEYKGNIAPKWEPRRWTALFFYDEALALAAGHRPCALCRRRSYERYQSVAGITGADAIDARLHTERLDGKCKRLHVMTWRDIPAGAYVEVEGVPHVALGDLLRPWSVSRGYGLARSQPRSGDAIVITPPLSIRAIAAGYPVQIASLDAAGTAGCREDPGVV